MKSIEEVMRLDKEQLSAPVKTIEVNAPLHVCYIVFVCGGVLCLK